ncbi:MAG: hypothetical protein A2W03_10635 [Candidatus Aminicenantes bacterium RBG_16_63_16]|nr:MAG: hypothetical protein A2W03_10635 [Candidatus Aminicenantes bacterium RBG_16_63_16]
MHYCAFLRGINVGGHALIKMEELKKAFVNMGFENVRTLLASGNVVFETLQSDKEMLTERIETELKNLFKKNINISLRSVDSLKALRSADPFRGIKVTPDIRLYVTFLSGKAKPRTITIPFAPARGEFRILRVAPREVFSVVDLSKGKGTTEAMNILEKEFGSDVTTRNWNTILKILEQTEKV